MKSEVWATLRVRGEAGEEENLGKGKVELTILSLPFPSLPSYLPTDALDSIKKWSTHISTVSPILQANLSSPAPLLKESIFQCIRLVPTSPLPSSSSTPLEETSAGLLIGTIGIWAS